MNASILNILLGAVIVSISAAVCAQNKNSDPTPRSFITPQNASKVRIYEAKQRRNFGVDSQGVVQNSTQVASSGFAKSCNTTIGPSGGNQTNSGRSGSAPKESTVIVTGDVINVCK